MDLRNKNEFHFKLLLEEAISIDCLEDRIHEKVADQILYVIDSNDSGVTIGLEGPWGAGKSTVVNILKRKISNRTLFFNFDAWAHEGDPLRRIFLENLINSADPKQKNEALQTLKKEATGRIKTVKIESKSKSSKLGTLLGLSALFVPFGAAILSGIDYKTIAMPWSNLKDGLATSFWFAFFFTFSPIWVSIYWLILGDKDSEGFLNRDWSFIHGSTSENYTQNVTEETERTSVEFESYFQKIFELMIGEEESYDRAIIVIDNLDRVTPETAKLVWSALQTFLQHRNSFSSIDTSKLWFLIPYDKNGISKIWSTGNEKDEPEISKSFIEKSIQLTIDVPLPIYSSWATYLETISIEALYDWAEGSRSIATSVFKRFEGTLSSPPTPRYMRRFINQIGVIALRWGGQVSTEAIALYALSKINLTSVELQDYLIAGNLPRDYKCIIDSNKVIQELAGMTFGVNPEKGMELLLGGELEKAIRDGNREKVSLLANAHKKSIITACHSTLKNLMPTSDHTADYNINFSRSIIELFNRFQVELSPEKNYFKNFWLDIHTRWDFKKFNYTSVLDDLHEIDPKWIGFKILRDKVFLKEFNICIKAIGTKDFNHSLLLNLNSFYKKLKNYTKPIEYIRYESITQSNISTWLKITKENKLDINFALPHENTIRDLANQLNNSTPQENICSILLAALPIYAEENGWEQVTLKLTQWLRNQNRQINNDIAYQLLCFMAAYLGEREFENIKLALSTPQFSRRIQRYTIQNMPGLCALSAIIFEEKIQESQTPRNIKLFWSDIKNTNKIEEVSKILRETGKISVLSALSKDKRNKAVIEHLKSNKINDMDELDNKSFA